MNQTTNQRLQAAFEGINKTRQFFKRAAQGSGQLNLDQKQVSGLVRKLTEVENAFLEMSKIARTATSQTESLEQTVSTLKTRLAETEKLAKTRQAEAIRAKSVPASTATSKPRSTSVSTATSKQQPANSRTAPQPHWSPADWQKCGVSGDPLKDRRMVSEIISNIKNSTNA